MNNNQLSGKIPSSVSNFPALQELNLSYNQFSGKIPFSIGNLATIRYLDLSSNQLKGNIPASIGNLNSLNYLNLSHNKLNGTIPFKITGIGYASDTSDLNYTTLYLSYNHFTFDGMQVVGKKFPYAVYDNQKRILIHQYGNALSVSAGGTLSKNTYHWREVVNDTIRTIATITGDSVFHPTENGVYEVNITNSVATQLMLRSTQFTYTAPVALIDASSSENMSRQIDEKIFLVYPNPAKDILYVKTQGITSYSLLNQAGEIVLTARINGKGSINISNVAAGLYYLKNNSSGVVKKIVIER